MDPITHITASLIVLIDAILSAFFTVTPTNVTDPCGSYNALDVNATNCGQALIDSLSLLGLSITQLAGYYLLGFTP